MAVPQVNIVPQRHYCVLKLPHLSLFYVSLSVSLARNARKKCQGGRLFLCSRLLIMVLAFTSSQCVDAKG